jgi:hypothetical protein
MDKQTGQKRGELDKHCLDAKFDLRSRAGLKDYRNKHAHKSEYSSSNSTGAMLGKYHHFICTNEAVHKDDLAISFPKKTRWLLMHAHAARLRHIHPVCVNLQIEKGAFTIYATLQGAL